jgi:hypothetical protein
LHGIQFDPIVIAFDESQIQLNLEALQTKLVEQEQPVPLGEPFPLVVGQVKQEPLASSICVAGLQMHVPFAAQINGEIQPHAVELVGTPVDWGMELHATQFVPRVIALEESHTQISALESHT